MQNNRAFVTTAAASTTSNVIAGLYRAIDHLEKRFDGEMDTRVKPAYDDWNGPKDLRT
jgi:hypothetical protein